MATSGTKPTIVYQAVNLIDGKRYIGITGRSLHRRRQGHVADSKRAAKTKFTRAIAKHGADMFRFSVLKTCGSFADACAEEIRLIRRLKPEYNLTLGGQGAAGVIHTPEHRRRTSEFVKANGHKAWAAAVVAHRKPVICISDGRIFNSCAEAAAHYGISRAAITMATKGRNATAAGRVFALYQDGAPPPAIDRDAVRRIRLEQRQKFLDRTPRTPVVCVNDGRRFSSVTEAGSAYGLTIFQVSRVITGERNSIYGLTFRYAKAAP